MSLHNLAQHLQSAGRGDDKVLVHMTPGEVKGLQSLAMAHGGSLTINPHTGLPEAGFLSSLLPTLAGLALNTFAPGVGTAIGSALGTSAAAGTGLLVGGVTTLATGSLGKGIMAGLGAYGGAGLGEALAGGAVAGALGAEGAGSAADILKASGMNQQQIAQQFAAVNANRTTGSTIADVAMSSANQAATADLAKKLALSKGADFAGMTQGVQGVITPTPVVPPIDVAKTAEKLAIDRASSPSYLASAAKQPTGLFGLDTRAGAEKLSAVGQGLKDIATDPKKLIQFVKDNPYESAAVASSIYSGMQEDQKFPEQKKGEPLKKLRYEYEPFPIGVAGTSERNYFPNARFTPTGEVYAARGGLMALAEGGTVEEMSRLNAVGANTMYPMANQMSYKYSTPRQRPISENVVRPEGEARLDPYTGEQKFADGGSVDPFAAAYFASLPDGADRLTQAQAIAREVAAIEAARAAPVVSAPAAAPSAPTLQGSFADTGPYLPMSAAVSQPAAVAAPTPSPQLRSQIEKLYESELYRPFDIGGLEHYEKLFAGGATPGLDPEEIALFRTAGEKEFASPEFAARKAAATASTGGTKTVDTGSSTAATGTGAVSTGGTATGEKSSGTVNIPQGAFYYGGGIPDPFGYGRTSNATTQAAESRFANTTFKLGSQAPTRGTQTSLATPSQVADIYERVLGRQVDLPGLEYYAKQQRMTPSALEQTLQYSPEFFENLAKPLVAPISYGASGIANIEGAPYFSPTQYGYAPTYTNAKNEIIGMYQEFLGRPPDRRGLEYWTNTIGRDNYISPREVQQFLLEADKEVDKRLDQFKPITEVPDDKDAIPYPGIVAPDDKDTIRGAVGNDTIQGGGTRDTISTDPNAYQYNYFDNSAQDNALIKQFQTGPNERARADLVELYMNTFKRLPDKPGFDYYMNTIGKDNEIDAQEREAFLKNAQPELSQRKALEDLYKEIGGRETDIPGREYWMSQIGKAGGIEPVREQIAAGLRKEIDMTNAGYPPAYTREVTNRLQNKTQAQIDAENAKAPFLYGTIPGSQSSKHPAGIDNNEAREQLYKLYETKLGRTPDMAGFDYWINTAGFGNDNKIDDVEMAKFLQGAREAGETVRMAMGGIANLGGYSDGGRLLKGPGDGVSDSIPAVIGNRQPARLADGEFVIPARIVSELGNGSTDAGARKLYAMMDRIQRARKKSVGKERVAINSKADKYLPA